MSKKKVKILVCLGCVTVGVLVGSSLAEMLKSFENDKIKSSTFNLLINSLTAIKQTIVKNLGYKNSKVFVIREHADFLSTWPEFEADIKEVNFYYDFYLSLDCNVKIYKLYDLCYLKILLILL